MSKNIVLLSDGTGNSAAKVVKTNVWRLYQALDVSATNQENPNAPVQIAFYDDGVGTSSSCLSRYSVARSDGGSNETYWISTVFSVETTNQVIVFIALGSVEEHSRLAC